MERYHRQTILQPLGKAGQEKLLSARVLVVGAGGLGCPILQYLTAAGTGTIGIVDNDVVNLTNLQRQVLYKMEDIGQPKTHRAKYHLSCLNPDIRFNAYQTFLQGDNALDIITEYDVIVDATDNFPSRYLINDACVMLQKPLVYGAVSQFEGQIAVFNVLSENGTLSANYRDIFPNPPLQDQVGNCSEIGVLGVLPGTVGCLQANEVIKLITGIGQPLINQIQAINLLTNQWQIFNIQPSLHIDANIPKDHDAFRNKDYSLPCAKLIVEDIDVATFNNYLQDKSVLFIDVREEDEIPKISEFTHLHLPMSKWGESNLDFQQNIIILYCQSGKRSRKAASLLTAKYPQKAIFSLQNGILDWTIEYKNQ